MKSFVLWARVIGILTLAAVLVSLCACSMVQGSSHKPSYGAAVGTGDVNGDGAVSKEDITLLRRYLIGEETLDKAQLNRGDVNGDGAVNAKDVYHLTATVNQAGSTTASSGTTTTSGTEIKPTIMTGRPSTPLV